MVFDPLDGSSNIDVNVSVGTIFSVLRCNEYLNQNDTLREEAFLQPGTTQVAAGYAIYGPQTMLMLTLGNGVKGFTLDRELGSFVLTHDNISVPESTAEFAINMSNQRHVTSTASGPVVASSCTRATPASRRSPASCA